MTMEIYNVSGRCILTMPLGVLAPGLHRTRWDGCNANGGNVGSGLYFIRLRGTDVETRAVKAVLVR